MDKMVPLVTTVTLQSHGTVIMQTFDLCHNDAMVVYNGLQQLLYKQWVWNLHAHVTAT